MRRPHDDPVSHPTRAERLHDLLADGTWHSTRELVRRIGHTFGGAVYVLRRTGYSVACERHPTLAGQHRYRLTR
jgi:hypothetical protein